MNAQARIVENYFRIIKRCFTITDVKVPAGQNRQFDILAYQPDKKKVYHIEVGITHRLNWCPTLNKLREMFKQKFFGVPQKKDPDNKNTDYAKGKDYLDQIKETYSMYSIKYEKVIRVWCFWAFKGDNEETIQLKNELAQEFNLDSENFETLSFRDTVIPELEMEIGTSNYDDETLRTISLLKQCKEQNSQHSIKNKIF